MSSATQTSRAFGIDVDWTSAGLAGVVELDPLERYAHRWTTGIGLGIVYGAVLWLVNLAFIWPVWLNAVGFPPGGTMAVPFLQPRPLVGHLVYGGILGAGYALLR